MSITAQPELQKQIEAICTDAPENFRHFKAQIKPGTHVRDSVFNSTIQIDGTTGNEIFKAVDGWLYSAVITESVSFKEAQKICDHWKKKLSFLATMGFKQEKVKLSDSSPVIYGWKFFKKDLLISIEVTPFSNPHDSNTVLLGIFNWR